MPKRKDIDFVDENILTIIRQHLVIKEKEKKAGSRNKIAKNRIIRRSYKISLYNPMHFKMRAFV